jgi:hypothetical protein
MKAYGLSVKEFENDSKKAGDLFGIHKNPSFAGTEVKNFLRRYKKVARREAHREIVLNLADQGV